ncbi:MAG: replicative DNA helicase [Acidimicrobiia bacterium]|nr:replicative DNA helicase [Acidimicrobiia bacterium]
MSHPAGKLKTDGLDPSSPVTTDIGFKGTKHGPSFRKAVAGAGLAMTLAGQAVSQTSSSLVKGVFVPPHSAEAEESVLGGMLRSSAASDDVMEHLSEEDFYVPAHRMIYGAMARLYEDNQPIDTLTVSDQLTRTGSLEKVGGIRKISGLWDAVPSAANVDYYRDAVAEYSIRRRMLEATRRIGDLAMNLDMEIEEVLDDAEQTMLKVSEDRNDEGLAQVGDLLMQVMKRLEDLEESGQEVTGLPTGLTDLDRKLGGLQPGSLIVVAGRPGMGKSALAMNIAGHVALNHGPVALFSLEMSPMEIAIRWLGSHARVDSMKLRSGLKGDNPVRTFQQLQKAAGELFGAPLHADERSRTVTDIRAQCRRMKRSSGLKLVVVDYMQLMQARTKENRQQEIAEISLNLKALARELNVPVIAVSQLNRALESRADRRPQLGDLRESGAIEQDADVVLMIYRDDYYNEQSDQRGIAEIMIAKQRAGPTGKIKTTFAAEYTRFENIARAQPPGTPRR